MSTTVEPGMVFQTAIERWGPIGSKETGHWSGSSGGDIFIVVGLSHHRAVVIRDYPQFHPYHELGIDYLLTHCRLIG